MSTSRLSDFIIEDSVIRIELYRKLLHYVNTFGNDVIEYEIKADEETNPELAAHRIYGLGELRWVLGIMCHVTDEFEPLPVGEAVKFPPLAIIQTTIRQVRDNA